MTEWADSPNVVTRTVRRVIATRPAAWLLARTIHHVDGATPVCLLYTSFSLRRALILAED